MSTSSTSGERLHAFDADVELEADQSRPLRIDDYVDAIILSTPSLRASDQAVLWRLVRYANRGSGRAWPSIARMAKDTHLHRDTVCQVYARLDRLGIVAVEHRAGRSPLVRFPIHPVLSTPRGKPARSDIHNPAGNPRHPADFPSTPRGKPATEPVYEPVYEPAPRCPQCDERHNRGARCPGRSKVIENEAAVGANVAGIDAIRERWLWQQ